MTYLSDFWSNLEVWKLVYWALGGGGIIAFIVLLFVAPPVARLLERIFLGIFEELLSTRIGVAVLTAVLVAITVNYVRRSADDANFAARTATFEQKQKDRDKKIADDTRAEVAQQIAELNAKNEELDRQLKEFLNALPAAPPSTPSPATPGAAPAGAAVNPFRVGRSACQLRVLAGTAGPAECGSPSDKGVPAARKKGGSPYHIFGKRLPAAGAGGAVRAPQGQ